MATETKTRYSHDYMHCYGSGCLLRDDCVHYLALKEAREIGLQPKDIKIVEYCENPELDYVKVKIEQ